VFAELLIYAMVVFGPWAFGTTQGWSVWVVNGMGYALSLLWLGSKVARRVLGYCQPEGQQRVGGDSCGESGGPLADARVTPYPGQIAHSPGAAGPVMKLGRPTTAGLAILTFALLGYCFISAVNSRAVYLPAEERFEYHGCILWLPHSFDSTSSWRAFWTLLALASSFWAIRDWLLGKTSSELKPDRRDSSRSGRPRHRFPGRLNRLLCVLCINGAALALEGIIQREADCPKLLFLIQPQLHRTAVSQFGPFAYRANGAEYFNLLWPVCLGFWSSWEAQSRQIKSHHLLMAACPLISTSRGGALVAFGLLIASGAFFLGRRLVGKPAPRGYALAALLLVVLGAPALGLCLGWTALKPRLATLREGLQDRARICGLAQRMAGEHILFGTGPGTYETVSELYRPNDTDFWPAQVHNDWLETRITFGVAGASLLALAGVLAASQILLALRTQTGRSLAPFIGFAFAGCLLHARFDFPFQVHSILTLFVVLSAVLCALSYEPPCRLGRQPAGLRFRLDPELPEARRGNSGHIESRCSSRR